MPIDTTDIERLAQILERSGLASIEIEESGLSLKLVMETEKPTASSSMLVAPAGRSHQTAVVAKADVAGIFIAVHPWREKPFVEPGQAVKAGAIVGLVKIGQLYVPVLSPAAATVDSIVAEPGATVGYGTPIVSFRAVA
ncbi:acetyl-CoA carboxylase biotin carboxyl carrier protein subunit [Bradyrhizobium sp. AUGA SZCCT0431]|uniref:acetyl-CoA carboxylase biotin carboxyl carrier protein n=1 Tax=Bradyrhizobium sp. AUGA SZCCT0431 TaxID=2807674 RepID=UPI001BA91D4E|nr:acetyl-CoA carboxylase biotin carboxyl carrier protein subunit [Bradyrhizobium sp. AUGA SZCCT0431]MBR1142584.1 acetyl-CoA carboxylase biotin carboxyl carrier protein subunit [Bradyrhizobium sp. AUGA SZCCT0431]